MASVALLLAFLINVLKVVFGLGFVIFIHELGHFLAAKWAGVKVEKFFLGFDPYGLRVAQFRRGETVYGIGAVPLGGYVKMLGQSDEGAAEQTDDPRAFNNKSVGARTVILSAGVVMNLVLGLVLFAVAYMAGVQEVPARLGMVEAGSPAYEAGLRPGDEIVAIDGKGDANFLRLKLKTSLSAAGQALRLTVRRPGVAEPLAIEVVPHRQAKADNPTIGILQCTGLSLYEKTPFDPPPGLDGPAPKLDALPEGGKVVEAGPAGGALKPVDDIFALQQILVAERDRAVDVVIEAPGKEKGSAPVRSRVTLPRVAMLDLGLRMTTGPVASIQSGSIAEKAGFRKGDRIVRVDGRDDFDPMRLPSDLYARAGKPTTFVVERTDGGKTETKEITATPDDSLPDVELVPSPTTPLKIPGLGLAVAVEPKVAAVADDGPAAKAGIRPGAVLAEVILPPLEDSGKDGKKEKQKEKRYVFGKPDAKGAGKDAVEVAWPYLFGYLQAAPRREIKVLVAGASTPVALTPRLDPTWSNPDRGLNFLTDIRDLPPLPFGQALSRAADETYDNVVGIYAMIRSLFSGRISTKNIAGLPRIAEISYHQASMGFIPLLQFLGMLSINLAVLNFLPIPPLDGGQIAFLIAEKARGKPLPDSAQTVLLLGGVVLVLCLMAFTILQDIYLLIFG